MTLDQLCDEYEAWTKAKGYDFLSADELLAEIFDTAPQEDIDWLNNFIIRWDDTANIED